MPEPTWTPSVKNAIDYKIALLLDFKEVEEGLEELLLGRTQEG